MRDFVPVRRVGWDRWLARRLSRCGARDSRFRCQLHRQPDDTSNAPAVVLTMRASRAEERISDSFAPAKPVSVLKSRSGPLRMPPPAFSLDAATQTRNRRRLRARCPRSFDPSLRSRCSLRQDDGSALALLAWFGEALRFLYLLGDLLRSLRGLVRSEAES